jgi:hypothetical protein
METFQNMDCVGQVQYQSLEMSTVHVVLNYELLASNFWVELICLLT